jgi:diguanylate cyclase (GGDEF)-like protein
VISRRATAYIIGVILVGTMLSGLALSGFGHAVSRWPAFLVLMPLCVLAHFYKAQGAGHVAWHANMALLFAGLLLLPPHFFVILVIIPHLAEWLKERLLRSRSLRGWYIQPFNMSTHIIAGSAARCVQAALGTGAAPSLSGPSVHAATTAALTYVLLNHVLIGQALVLARRATWRQSAVFDAENLLTDVVLAFLGYILAVVWPLNHWLILPALSPLLLIYRTLSIPRLERQAQTDSKTGLWNARHFTRLFTAEMDRARRFGRPLALIMADLDLLRNINNTYGHLAGDQVLAGIGRIIRQTTRDYDIAARFGGEEFTILLHETGPAEARSYAERLRQAVEAADFEVTTSPTPLRATMSLGVACFPLDATIPASLIHEADVAVYQAKLRGRNCVVSAPEVADLVERDSVALEDRLRAPYAAAYNAWPV